MTPVPKQAFKVAFDKFTLCKSTGRPVRSRKVSLGKAFPSFNQHVQVDCMFIGEMKTLPMLHMVDTSTAFSVTVLMDIQDMEPVAREFDVHWCKSMVR